MEVTAVAIQEKSNWINYLVYLMLNTLLNVLWVSISPQLNLSEFWVVKPMQEKDQKVFDMLRVVYPCSGSACPWDSKFCAVLMLHFWYLKDTCCKFFSELEEMSWKIQSQTLLLFSSKSPWQMEAYMLSRETPLPSPRWGQRFRSNRWNH